MNSLRFLLSFTLLLLLVVACTPTEPPPAPTTNTYVVLFPDDNPNSSVTIGEGPNAAVLDQPLSSAAIDTAGQVSVRPTTATEAEQEFSQALAAQPPVPISFVLYFETGTTTVLPESQETLKELFAEVAKRQAVEVEVTGHTDTVGKTVDNDQLSIKRAEAIKEMLVRQGIAATFIRAVGRGERELLVMTNDNVDESKNRRVEVVVR